MEEKALITEVDADALDDVDDLQDNLLMGYRVQNIVEMSVLDIQEMRISELPADEDFMVAVSSITLPFKVTKKCPKLGEVFIKFSENEPCFLSALKNCLYLLLLFLTKYNKVNMADYAKVEADLLRQEIFDTMARSYYEVFQYSLSLESKFFQNEFQRRSNRGIRLKSRETIKDLFITAFIDTVAQLILLWLQEYFDVTQNPILQTPQFRFDVLNFCSYQFLGFKTAKLSNSVGENSILPSNWFWTIPRTSDDEDENHDFANKQETDGIADDILTTREVMIRERDKRLTYLTDSFDAIEAGNLPRPRRRALCRDSRRRNSRKSSAKIKKYQTFKRIRVSKEPGNALLSPEEKEELVNFKPHHIFDKRKPLTSNLIHERVKYRRKIITLSHSPLISYLCQKDANRRASRASSQAILRENDGSIKRATFQMMQSQAITEFTTGNKVKKSNEEKEQAEVLRQIFLFEPKDDDYDEELDDMAEKPGIELTYKDVLEDIAVSREAMAASLKENMEKWYEESSKINKEFLDLSKQLKTDYQNELKDLHRTIKASKKPIFDNF